jgi:hypothetical protein
MREFLTRRDRAVLAAVADGRCALICGCEPDLLVDGLWFCDQARVHSLIALGLLAPVVEQRPGCRVPATLTEAGRAELQRLTAPVIPAPAVTTAAA